MAMPTLLAKCPAWHFDGAARPLDGHAEPRGHRAQTSAPASGEKDPGLQGTGAALPASHSDPAGQATQEEALSLGW
jgi:hypothetical protein